MAAVRRGQRPLNLDLPNSQPPNDLPLISALFLIYFDIKAGYTIGWKRSLPGIELEGVVEYKSLPSGLHTVKEDLIYFVHDNHAGLSAFVNAPAAEESRNARMIAVGIMVPLSYGRLGRAWKHAEKLKEMARYVEGLSIVIRQC
jgi:DENN domain-containing protein 11